MKQTEIGQPKRSRYHIDSLARGLRVLSLFAHERRALSLAQLTEKAGLDKSTTFRIVSTLTELGYLRQDGETKKYRPGLRVLDLGFAALASMGLVEIASPYMQTLSSESGHTVSLAILDRAEIVYVDRIKAESLIYIDLHVGSRLPAYCTSLGKALLAYLPEEKLAGLTALDLHLPDTRSFEEFRDELGRIRQQGYAINDEELTAGLRSVAAPIRSRGGVVIAAVNMAVIAAQVDLTELTSVLAPAVVETAQKISAALGHSAGNVPVLTPEDVQR